VDALDVGGVQDAFGVLEDLLSADGDRPRSGENKNARQLAPAGV
jgi:hypothetical protein